MVALILVFVLAIALIAIVNYTLGDSPDRAGLMQLMSVAYIARMFFVYFLSDLPIFSYGAGGDAVWYQILGEWVAKSWQFNGVHYVTSQEIGAMGSANLPSNLFAVVVYLGGPENARYGNAAIIAFLACITCLIFYSLAIELGLESRVAFRVSVVWMFTPAFFLYTADTYKDGIVLFLVMAAFSSAVRLSRKLSVTHAILGALACIGLLGCRYYLIFVVLSPLFVSLIGLGSGNLLRQVLGLAALVAGFIGVFTFTTIIESAQQTADSALMVGELGIASNARGASGVTFDDGGSVTGALHLKLAYTLLSPFPWQGGSIALQFGKIEALAWWYFIYRGFVVGRRLVRENPSLLLMFVTFIVPTTIMYALFMSNVGLVVRERMPIVMLGTLLGALSWTRPGALRWNTKVAEATQAPASEPAPAE